jgi:hypothetical protein
MSDERGSDRVEIGRLLDELGNDETASARRLSRVL